MHGGAEGIGQHRRGPGWDDGHQPHRQREAGGAGETELVGAYTYGTEQLPDGSSARTFELARDLVGDADLGRLVSAHYRLTDDEDALLHAASAGSRGAIKICFDLRS